MLNVNDGGGLYTTAGLIDSIIVELNDVETKGIENMGHIISSIQKLSSVKNAVIKMEAKIKEMGDIADDAEDQQPEDV